MTVVWVFDRILQLNQDFEGVFSFIGAHLEM